MECLFVLLGSPRLEEKITVVISEGQQTTENTIGRDDLVSSFQLLTNALEIDEDSFSPEPSF